MAKETQKKLTAKELENLQQYVAESKHQKEEVVKLHFGHTIAMDRFKSMQERLDKFGEKLEKKYGNINVSIETGEFVIDDEKGDTNAK
tara:strand:- start:19597 stop:19860 length:264 start_codon:yes stop_codon:yes gene_type:complete